MRSRRVGLFCSSTALLAACGGPATECADIGGYPGVQITADDYRSDATAGHTVEVCADRACATAPLDDPFPFVVPDDLREDVTTSLAVVVRDQQGLPLQTTTLEATPVQYKPGGDACQFSLALVHLSLTPEGVAQSVDEDQP